MAISVPGEGAAPGREGKVRERPSTGSRGTPHAALREERGVLAGALGEGWACEAEQGLPTARSARKAWIQPRQVSRAPAPHPEVHIASGGFPKWLFLPPFYQ